MISNYVFFVSREYGLWSDMKEDKIMKCPLVLSDYWELEDSLLSVSNKRHGS